MITLGPILIFAVAVTIIVSYVLIIHKSLSGDAANNPNHDASVGHHDVAPAINKTAATTSASLSGRGHPSHA